MAAFACAAVHVRLRCRPGRARSRGCPAHHCGSDRGSKWPPRACQRSATPGSAAPVMAGGTTGSSAPASASAGMGSASPRAGPRRAAPAGRVPARPCRARRMACRRRSARGNRAAPPGLGDELPQHAVEQARRHAFGKSGPAPKRAKPLMQTRPAQPGGGWRNRRSAPSEWPMAITGPETSGRRGRRNSRRRRPPGASRTGPRSGAQNDAS